MSTFAAFNKINLDSHKNIKISDFTYNLPDDRIAKYPPSERDTSKLLVWKNGEIHETVFNKCADFLPHNAQLYFNNTRVIHARLYFRKETGAKIEIFCLEPVDPSDYQIAFQEKERVIWKCMVGNSKKWKSGILKGIIEFKNKQIVIEVKKIKPSENSFLIEFRWNNAVTFGEIIETAGELPIPPYLNRHTEDSDEESYQTIYAKVDGSVAAPTAGLHFTKKVLNGFSIKNISINEITLHVGAGTFQPVKSDRISGHIMHHELVTIPKKIIQKLIDKPDNIIAVGTTSVRSLESLYWLGCQLYKDTFNDFYPEVKQWEPYENNAVISTKEALHNILKYLNKTNRNELQFSTQIIILPGYNFKIIKGMFTNFHLPQSTLLLLISAFLGDKWIEVYDYALVHDFRFLSYGDSNLYLK